MAGLPFDAAARPDVPRRRLSLASVRPVPVPLHLLGAGLWGLVGLLLVLTWAPDGWQAAVGACMLTQAFCLAVLFHRLPIVRSEVLPDFLTVYLLFQLLNKSFTMVSLAAGELYRDESWYDDIFVESTYQFQAELVFLAATGLFTLGWLEVERRQRFLSGGHIIGARQGLYSFYTVCMVTYFVLRVLPGGASLGLLPDFLRYGALGAVTALLGANPRMALGTRASLLPVLMLLPLLYLAAVSGMKSQMIVVCLPIIVSTIKYPSRVALGAMGGFALFLVALIVPLSQAMRTDDWISTRGVESIGLADGLSRVGDAYVDEGLAETVIHNAVWLCHRASSADIGGLVMQISANDGHIGSEPVKGILGIFIPRFLWADKPSYQPGAWFTWYLGKAYSPETATSSTATMLGTEIFWMYGALGVFVLMPALGAVYSLAWQGMRRLSSRGFMGLAGMLALLVNAPRFEESHAVYAASAPIIFLVYAVGLGAMEGLFRAASGARR